jgi:hypothetical protein
VKCQVFVHPHLFNHQQNTVWEKRKERKKEKKRKRKEKKERKKRKEKKKVTTNIKIKFSLQGFLLPHNGSLQVSRKPLEVTCGPRSAKSLVSAFICT